MDNEKEALTYLNSNQHLQKIIKKEIIKENKNLINNFQTIGIINSFTNENKLLYHLLKKFKINCAYLSNQEFCCNQKIQYFYEAKYTELYLNTLYKKLKDEGVTHIIFNISPEQYEQLHSLQLDYCIINDMNISTSKEIKIINKILKRTSKSTIVSSDDQLYKKLRYKDYFVTIGKTGQYKINDYIFKQNRSIVRLEHIYNQYTIFFQTHNPHIMKSHLLSIITVSKLGYDLQEVINKYKKIRIETN